MFRESAAQTRHRPNKKRRKAASKSRLRSWICDKREALLLRRWWGCRTVMRCGNEGVDHQMATVQYTEMIFVVVGALFSSSTGRYAALLFQNRCSSTGCDVSRHAHRHVAR
jgi:hypothetical protein